MYFKNSIVFICIWCINCMSAAKVDCDWNYGDFGFNRTNVGLRPAKFFLILDITDPDDPGRFLYNDILWKVNISKIQENFRLTVLVDPFIKTRSDCPPLLIGNETLRRYKKTCTVNKSTDENKAMYFHKIVTGCYYLITINETGNIWISSPVFRNTSNRFYNTKLEVIKGSTKFKPPMGESPRELRTELKIPLSCIEVRTMIYELKEKIDALDHIEKFKILSTQECWFKKNGSEVKIINCKGSNLMTNITLDVKVGEQRGEEWIAIMRWKNLQYGGGMYYFWVESYTTVCEHKYNDSNINTWKIIGKNYRIDDLGYQKKFNGPYGPELPGDNYDSIIILIVCISLGIIVIAAVIYWKWNYLSALKGNLQAGEELLKVQENVPLYNGFDHILLMYVRDSPPFMEVMKAFRQNLKQACNCHVYDLYTLNELNKAAKSGAAEWVEQLLRDGIKVVWVDTPQFRSRLNNQQEQYTQGDFRDAVIPYAVTLATNLFLNAATQYNQHFVVRVKGYEVEDERDDRLRFVSPHTRYFIPEHQSLLCEHLRKHVKNLEDTRNEN